MEREDRLNQVLVHLFNDALRIEERSLAGCAPMLSLREVHVIEALCAAGENNTMSALAARLHVTVGSLTVAVSTLARKGYCRRERDTADRRHVRILPTERALALNEAHTAFHREMVAEILQSLPLSQQESLLDGLACVSRYFERKEQALRV